MEKKLYANALGCYEAKASVSAIGSKYCFSTVSDAEYRSWQIAGTHAEIIGAIIDELERDGWTCTMRRDGFNHPALSCVHRDTQSAIDEIKNAQEAKFAGAEHGYVRYGTMPKCGYSINHRDNEREAGVSVFEAEFAADGSFRPILPTHVLEMSYVTVMDRQAYRVYGEVVGTGADGEPVLKVNKTRKIK